MAYVEWLRVRRVLVWSGIALASLFVLAAIGRFGFVGVNGDAVAWAFQQQSNPSATVARTILPDGTHRTTIDNPSAGYRVTIDDNGGNGQRITILDAHPRKGEHDRVVSGSMHVRPAPDGKGTLTFVDTTHETPFINFAGAGVIVAFIVATVLGAPFGRENDGHLEIALTKPETRVATALATIAADVAGIVAVFGAAIAVAIVTQGLFETPHITWGTDDLLGVAVLLLAPLAWYALLAAATASMKRGYGAVQGFAWPVAIVVLTLTLIHPNGNALLGLLRDAAQFVSYAVPLTYAHAANNGIGLDAVAYTTYRREIELGALVALFVLYAGAAIAQWRRIEA